MNLLNRFKILFIIFFLFFFSCDFRVPQEWETPSWEFDLTIPLVNQDYSMASIATDSNSIEIFAPDSTDFIISLQESIINQGDVVTDEAFFIIPPSSIDFSLAPTVISNPSPMPEFPSISEEFSINDYLPSEAQGLDCIPKSIETDIDETIEINVDSLCDGLDGIECINQINSLMIGEGQNNLSIDNGFPFEITEFSLKLASNGLEFVNIIEYNIGGSELVIDSLLNGKEIGCEVQATINLKINRDLEATSNAEECNFYQTSCETAEGLWFASNGEQDCYLPITMNEEVCSELDDAIWDNNLCITLLGNNEFICNGIDEGIWDETNNQCYAIIMINQTVCTESGASWVNNGCYLACLQEETCCESLAQGTWNDNICESPLINGLSIDGNETLVITNEISIDNFASLNADIECIIDSSFNTVLPINENISLIEGHIQNLEALDTNIIKLNLTNNLFTDILFQMSSDNLFDSFDNNLNVNEIVTRGSNFSDINLSNYTIKDIDNIPIESLLINFSTSLNQNNVTINFDEEYGISGDGITTKTIKLDELKVNLNDFNSSDINMGSIPSGFDGFDIPFLSFNLYLYNQISANMKLYLDLFGITDDDTLKIHVEPDIKFLDILNPYISTDSLLVSFYKDSMLVKHLGNDIEHTSPIIADMDHKITDLFSYDAIEVSGYAVMDGDATLLPNKSLWGDLEIIIQPLTLILEDHFSFVSNEFTEFGPMDSDVRTKIDSGLVSASINMSIDNQIPFGGNLLMYLSNKPNYFPLCIDSLSNGILDNQEVSDSCLTNLQYHLNCDLLEIEYNDNSTFVKNLECSTGDSLFYYKNLLNLEFDTPYLDQWGSVVETSNSFYEYILDEEIYYLTDSTKQFLIPRFVFDAGLDTVTFQPTNSLSINSYIILKLLTNGLLD